MYSIDGFGSMIANEPRMQAYHAALMHIVGPDSVVLDLGSGSGIMAFLACRLGAREVIAVEPDNVLGLARQIAKANGLESRIRFIHALSTAVEPPRRCNVVVADLRGALPLFRRHIPAIVDVRDRWLAPSGIQVPQQDSIFGAVIESPRVWDRHFRGWTTRPGQVDLSPALRVLSGCPHKVVLGPEELLTEPARWARIDYRTVTSSNHEAQLAWSAPRSGTGHGIALWFESELIEGVTLSSRPGDPPLIYGQLYFPWPERVTLEAGERVRARIRAHLLGDSYVWAWNTDIHHGENGGVRRRFRQSTLQGAVWTSEWLAGRRLDARPALSAKGRAALDALRAMEGRATAQEVSSALMERFPAEFPSPREAVRFVSSLHAAYGE